MAAMAAKQVGLKLDPDLHALAANVAQVSGESFKGFITACVKRELDRRFAGTSGKKLRRLIEEISDYRKSIGDEG